MILVIQTVKNANCVVEEKIISKINNGFLIYVGVNSTDTINDVMYCVQKVAKLRLFANAKTQKINENIVSINGQVLAISNFTLLGDTTKNNRPSFTNAAKYEDAQKLYDLFCHELGIILKSEVKKGKFGADMQINSTVDGPVNLIINSNDKIVK